MHTNSLFVKFINFLLCIKYEVINTSLVCSNVTTNIKTA